MMIAFLREESIKCNNFCFKILNVILCFTVKFTLVLVIVVLWFILNLLQVLNRGGGR